MQEFLFLLKGDGMNQLSPDELQNVMKDFQAWVDELGEDYLGGQRLEEQGSILKTKSDTPITDGPFLESKEIIAGFFMIQAKSLEHANQIAYKSPHLGLYQIEIRPIAYPKMK